MKYSMTNSGEIVDIFFCLLDVEPHFYKKCAGNFYYTFGNFYGGALQAENLI